MNRMHEQEVQLRLRVSSFGFGLGFKDHMIHKVQPGSTAELSGLRLNDTIVHVNGQSVVELPDVDVLQLIKTTEKTLHLVVKRLLPMQPAASVDGTTDEGGELAYENRGGSRENPFSPTYGGFQGNEGTPRSPDTDFVTESPLVDEAEVSQGVRDSSYVKMMRERLEGYEAKLAERDSTIKALRSEKNRIEGELSAVLKQGEEDKPHGADGEAASANNSMLDDMLPRLPTVRETDYTMQNLVWSMEKHVAATRIAAAPLETLAKELPTRVTTAIDGELEFQAAASNQARVSQAIDPGSETTGQQQLAMSRASSRVISASDGKQQAEKSLSDSLQEIQSTVDHVTKTARLAEHHISKLSALLEEMPQLGKIIIANEEDNEVTW